MNLKGIAKDAVDIRFWLTAGDMAPLWYEPITSIGYNRDSLQGLLNTI